MEIKELNIIPRFFKDIKENNVDFLIIKNKDGKKLKIDDYVLLCEYDDLSKSYLNDCMLIKVLKVYDDLQEYIYDFGLKEKFIIFHFKLLDINNNNFWIHR